jgi:predicted O-methyltransferase YrrM
MLDKLGRTGLQLAIVRRRALAGALRRSEGVSSGLRRYLIRATLSVHGCSHAQRIPSWTSEAELWMLHRLARSCPPGANALEIGSYLGASTCYLAAGLRASSGRLYCVDTWTNETMPDGPRDTFADFRRNTAAFANIITAVRKRSDRLVVGDVPVPLELVFIDGDHDYAAASGDFALVAPMMSPGGVVAFHDVGVTEHAGVGRVLGEAIASGDWGLEGMVDSLAWIRRRSP